MTSNRTIKTSIKRSLIVAMALAGTAWMSSAQAVDAMRIASAAQTAPTQTQQRFDVRNYGDRFKLAIAAIRKDSQKPDWTWEEAKESRVAKTK